jgi:hypothetical protein
MPVAGYPTATSVRQGASIGLFVASDSDDPVSLSVSRVGVDEPVVWSGVAEVRRVPDAPEWAKTSFGWSATVPIAVPMEWPSGLYRVQPGSGGAGFCFTVAAAAPGSTSRILLMYPATRGQAYNTEFGASLYEFNSGGVAADRVSFDRPGGLTYDREVPFARWFERSGIVTEACTNIDVHGDPTILSSYQLVVSMGHDEYWTREMRDAVEGFITAGGNVAFLSANVCWWQVRLESDNRVMVCYKDAAADPLTGVDDSRVTVNWADAPVNRPENSLTGVGWRKGGMAAGAAFECRFPEHWVFEGTGLAERELFGAGSVNYETDACDYLELDGRPRATCADGTPDSFVIVATCDYTQTPGDAPGYATMGLYNRGGTVFAAATTDWGIGLDRGDAHLDTITRNVVTRLSQRSAAGTWERIGEANGVIAMAADAGRLFAADRDGVLWQREATGQNVHWTAIGDAPAVVALAANGYAKFGQHYPLLAVNENDVLLSRVIDARASWSSLGSANGCRSIAVNNYNIVHGVDASNSLWLRNVASAAGTPWSPHGSAGIGVRQLAGHYRSLIACDDTGRLWRRVAWEAGTPPAASWELLGEALPGVRAIAVTQGILFAATSDDTLWRRDLARLSRPNDALFVSQAVSPRMQPGESQRTTVTMRNVGSELWTAAESYGLGSQEPPDNVVWGLGRVALPEDAAPGATVNFEFDITAPTSPGTYPFRWRMLQEAVEWFGDTTPPVAIRVPGPPTEVPDVREDNRQTAAASLVAAGLAPEFTGAIGPNAWAESQSPRAGSTVEGGSTVRVHMTDRPRP